MPANRQERFQQARKMKAASAPQADNVLALRTGRIFGDLADHVRRHIERFTRQFDSLSPVAIVDKRTAFFNAVAAEPNGIAILHDMGEALDNLYAFANDYRDAVDPILVQPFTDANVTYYEANGVSN